MKKLIIALAMMLMASQAMAVAYVDWFCNSGFFTADSLDAYVNKPDGGDEYPYGNIGVGQSVLWALMYTTSDAYGTATATTVGHVSTVHLSDTIAAFRYFEDPGWANMSSEVGENGVNYDPGLFALSSGGSTGTDAFEAGSGYTGGYFYQAVFANVVWDGTDITFTDSSIYYTFTGRDANDGVNPLGEPKPTAQDLPSGSTYSGVRVDSVLNAVPEPATMSLLGLGALVMAIRRRRS